MTYSAKTLSEFTVLQLKGSVKLATISFVVTMFIMIVVEQVSSAGFHQLARVVFSTGIPAMMMSVLLPWICLFSRMGAEEFKPNEKLELLFQLVIPSISVGYFLSWMSLSFLAG